MKNELFSIGPITIYGYGLMIAIGCWRHTSVPRTGRKSMRWIRTKSSM